MSTVGIVPLSSRSHLRLRFFADSFMFRQGGTAFGGTPVPNAGLDCLPQRATARDEQIGAFGSLEGLRLGQHGGDGVYPAADLLLLIAEVLSLGRDGEKAFGPWVFERKPLADVVGDADVVRGRKTAATADFYWRGFGREARSTAPP